jgi:hypothetical protein
MGPLVDSIYFCVAIWLSQRAKPFAQMPTMPYRWGVFLGLMAARMSVLCLISSITAFRAAYPLAGFAAVLAAVLAAVASLGMLRRQRFGAWSFGLAHITLILILVAPRPVQDPPVWWSMWSEPPLPEMFRQLHLIPAVIFVVSFSLYFVFTVLYFKDRWALMGEVTGPGSGALVGA